VVAIPIGVFGSRREDGHTPICRGHVLPHISKALLNVSDNLSVGILAIHWTTICQPDCDGNGWKAAVWGAKLVRMRAAAHCAALTALLSLSACASTPPTPVEKITVARRNWFVICMGVCPKYDVTVWSDGRVLAVRHIFEAPDEVEKFQVSRRNAAKFRAKLLAYRPVVDPPAPTLCDHHLSQGEAPLLIKVTEIEIRWSDNHPNRLVACDTAENRKLIEDIRQALWSVHLYLTAHRRDRQYQR